MKMEERIVELEKLLREGAAHLKALERYVDELTRAGDALEAEVRHATHGERSFAQDVWLRAKAERPRA